MEIKKSVIRVNNVLSSAKSQITLDDDCIVSDKLPDAARIIHTEGCLLFEEPRVNGQTAAASGQLKFTVLYRSTEDRLEALSDTVHFTEKIYMDGINEAGEVKLCGRLEDLSIALINSRKLAVRALVELSAVSEEQTQNSLISRIEEDEGIEQLVKSRRMLSLSFRGRDLVRVHRQIPIPAASPNIGRIIYSHVDIRKKDAVLVGTKLKLQGEAVLSILYLSDEGTEEWYETAVPFEESPDVVIEGEEPVFRVESTLFDSEISAGPDGDGEQRMITADLVFDADISIWKEEDIEVLCDAYAPGRTIELKKAPTEGKSLLVKNEAVLKIGQQMKLPDEAGRILQLRSTQGTVGIDSVKREAGFLSVEGVLGVQILYASPDDGAPLLKTTEQLPFSQKLDVPGMTEDESVSWEISPGIVQLSVNLLDQEHYEIKAQILLAALVTREEIFECIEEIEEKQQEKEADTDGPGIIGYRVGDESMWELAKVFDTTCAKIMEINGLTAKELTPGQRLIIVKNM